MNDQRIRDYTLNTPYNSKFHILGDVLDIGVVHALYLTIPVPTEEFK